MLDDEYHADRTAVSSTWLKHLAISPKHLKHYLEYGSGDSRNLVVGRATHCATFEADRFDKDYPLFAKELRSKDAKAEWQALIDEGKQPLKLAEYETVRKLSNAVLEHKSVQSILSAGEPELAMFSKNADTGVLCKAKADWLRKDDGWIWDLKKTTDVSKRAFRYAIKKYGYDIQAAHYCDVFGCNHFGFIVVEDSANPLPLVKVYPMRQEDIQRANERRITLLETYKNCKAFDHWPGPEECIETIDLWSNENE